MRLLVFCAALFCILLITCTLAGDPAPAVWLYEPATGKDTLVTVHNYSGSQTYY